MGGDPLRHVVHRRVHLERSQVKGRKHLGLLEKHGDYVLRARDYHKKEKKLERLREKALTRNPDEFYYKMISSRVDDKGRFQFLPKTKSLAEKKKELLQNKSLVSLKHSIQYQALRKAEERLHHVILPKQGSHIFFYDEENDPLCEKDLLEKMVEEQEIPRDLALLEQASAVGAQLAKRQSKTLSRKKAVSQATEDAVHVIQTLFDEYSALDERAREAQMFRKAQDLLETQYNLTSSNHVRKIKGSDGIRNLYKSKPRRLK